MRKALQEQEEEQLEKILKVLQKIISMIENHIYLDLIIVKNLKKMDYFYLYNFFIFIYIYL
jgi:hypothetical protein